MSTISPTYIYDNIRKKPKIIDESRLIQAARVNALGNVFNLIGQAAFGSQGATITPMQDKVTPYVMNEFNRQRMMDLQSEQQERNIMLREMLRQATLDEDRQYKRGLLEEQRDYQAERDKRTGNTFEQKMDIAKVRKDADLENWKEREEISQKNWKERTQIGYDNAKNLVFLREKFRKENDVEKLRNKYKPIFEVKGNQMDEYELNSLFDVVTGLSKNPEIVNKLKQKNQLYGTLLQYNPDELSDKQWQDILTLMWDDIEPQYKAIHDERTKFQSTGQVVDQDENKTVQKQQPKKKITW